MTKRTSGLYGGSRKVTIGTTKNLPVRTENSRVVFGFGETKSIGSLFSGKK